jgi:hypothetical protein
MQNEVRKIVLILLLFTLSSGIGSLQVHAASAPYEFSLDLQTYKSTKITFNYPYTNNHSISDISTVGQSQYKHEGSGNYLTFIAEDIDIYSFTVTLGYENSTSFNQTKNVLIGLWSGIEAMDGYTVSTTETVIVIHVRLSLTEQPTYPTPDEVSQAVVHKIEQDLVQQTEEMRSLVARVEWLQYMIVIVIAVTITVAMCALIIAIFMVRRRGPR